MVLTVVEIKDFGMIVGKSFLQRMIELPLFQGMSKTDLEDVAGHTKLGFQRVAVGKSVVNEGTVCEQVFLLMSGEVSVVSRADDGAYSLCEQMEAPIVFQLECLFGLTPRFTRSVVAKTPSQFITISKAELLSLCERNEIFRLNLLNILSTIAQRSARHSWRQPPQEIRQKLFRFIEQRSLRPAGPKVLRVKMSILSSLLGESRLNVSRVLNAMTDEGLLSFSRGIIQIPALELLR